MPPSEEAPILQVFGAEYLVDWPAMARGSSVFLPTTATPAQVVEELKPIAAFYDYLFEVRARCEFDRFGVRVWRTS